MKLDYSKLENVQVDGIDTDDYPDFCDAYICYAEIGGRELTDVELDELNSDQDYVYSQVERRLY